jgi:hypothetical protein
MGADVVSLPDDFPEYLSHSEEDTPVPTWQQVTRSLDSRNAEMIERVSRIVADTTDEERARQTWDSWPGNYRRSVALLIDKIYHEGWLDAVGAMEGWPWDGGFFFWPPGKEIRLLRDTLNSKSGRRGVYTELSLHSGLFAYLNSWNHKGWKQGWMENDSAMAALHVGIFENGSAEVHLDTFNPLFTNNAPRKDLIRIPFVGSYNHKQFLLHRRWEQSEYAATVRRSANFYYMMRDSVPLCF